jgi:hypothetical protein
MAPEHLAAFANRGGAKVDRRSDLYALGLILYQGVLKLVSWFG